MFTSTVNYSHSLPAIGQSDQKLALKEFAIQLISQATSFVA